jgi:hypothetical protein
VRAFLSSQICQTTSRSRECVPFFGTTDELTMNHHSLIEEEFDQVAGAKGPMDSQDAMASQILLD